MLKKLSLLLGPVLLALVLAVLTIFCFPTSLSHSYKAERESAVAISDFAFKNGLVKRQALEDKKHHFVPFFGSSEWSRMDSMHPSILAEKYDRSYRPYLIGNKGSQSLIHYYGMQQISKALNHKKAVFVISPQWFTPQGTIPGAVQSYLSRNQIFEFLLNQQNDVNAQYAARRLLELHPNVSQANLLRQVSQGKPLSSFQRHFLKMQYQLSTREESLFSVLAQSHHFQTKIEPRLKGLPRDFSYQKLEELANRRGKVATSNNTFGIKNSFYRKRIAKDVKKFKMSQKMYTYTNSPEYNDFQLVLSEFAKEKTDVLFVIPPVNQEWAKYTGLSQEKYLRAVYKIKYQLKEQGFDNIADFSNDGDDPYFMQDTIHLGWNGWLALDKVVQPFLEIEKNTTHYKINPYFYTEEWAKKDYVTGKETKAVDFP
ncbi:D-alanyl-lipoteichoic acid biosynthesis protein DltD [Streptococcus pluranimalium]|uniref:D-alanyl-lipoteichoic acid biosynthesis protein DltD n=1 Tax=Streptococcus pluranimalium TaxID=82348 RepID=UPI003F68F12D